MTDWQQAEKRLRGEAYADKFPRRKRKLRKKARRERVLEREARWLRLSGIARDTDWPLA